LGPEDTGHVTDNGETVEPLCRLLQRAEGWG